MHLATPGLLGVLTIALLLTACGGDSAPTQPVVVVAPTGVTTSAKISHSRLPLLTIAAGTEVTWTNEDGVEHTSTSGIPKEKTGTWDSGPIAAGQTFSFTFTQSGEFAYFCDIHKGMRGTVTVTAP